MAQKRTKKRTDRPDVLRRWQLLEVVAHVLELEHGAGSSVTYNAQLSELQTGTPRQVDVAVELVQAGRRFLRIVEVQHRNRKVTLQQIDNIQGKLSALGAHRATMVATAGFTHTAIERVRIYKHQIDARSLIGMSAEDWPDWMAFHTVNVHGEAGPVALTHRRCIDASTEATIADLFFGEAKSIGGVICFVVPPGGRAPDLKGWIIGNDPTLEGFEVRMKHHDDTTGTRGHDVSSGRVFRWKDGEPIKRD